MHRSLGAVIDTEEETISFKKLGLYHMPGVRTSRGHLGINMLTLNDSTRFEILQHLQDNMTDRAILLDGATQRASTNFEFW